MTSNTTSHVRTRKEDSSTGEIIEPLKGKVVSVIVAVKTRQVLVWHYSTEMYVQSFKVDSLVNGHSTGQSNKVGQ